MTEATHEGAAQAAPSFFVRDWRGTEITVGSTVVYGTSDNPDEASSQTAKVIRVCEPDVEFFEDENGMDVAKGIAVLIVIQFDDGDTDNLKASYVGENMTGQEIYEESGDIEVIEPVTKG